MFYAISHDTALFLPDDRGYAITPLLISGTTVFKSATRKSKSSGAFEVWVTRAAANSVPTKKTILRDWSAMVSTNSKVANDSGCKQSKPLVFSCQRTYQDGRFQIGFWNQLKDVVNLEVVGSSLKSKEMTAWSKDVSFAATHIRLR